MIFLYYTMEIKVAWQASYEPFDKSTHEDYLIETRVSGSRIYRSQPISRVDTTRTSVWVLKVVPPETIESRKPHNVRNEAMILSNLSHPNIVELKSAFLDAVNGVYELRMPFIELPLGLLLNHPCFSTHPMPIEFQHMRSPFKLSSMSRVHEEVSRSIVFQIIGGVHFLHSRDQPVAHRDINPGNVLLTRSGLVKLIDFGVSWNPRLGKFAIVGEANCGDVYDWVEAEHDMCSQLATGPFRAPELMYSPKVYDAYATDLWSLGVTIALFFAPLHLEVEDDLDSISSKSESQGEDIESAIVPGYKFSPSGNLTSSQLTWKREPLFDANRGEIGLLWSIFRVLGTPTKESWPDFPGHQENAVIRFRDAPRQDLRPMLPHLPSSDSGALSLIEGFLQYPPQNRLKPNLALENPWFVDRELLLLPLGYPLPEEPQVKPTNTLDGFTLEDILDELIQKAESTFEQNKQLRGEWD
ncbi:kinase-like protein [Serendipita vermifera]|nr:kinase-like protein [Serendipita vermifera]